MSYSEKDGQVVLTLSREDYNELVGIADAHYCLTGDVETQQLLNRLNQGNPNFTPYQVGEKKSR